MNDTAWEISGYVWSVTSLGCWLYIAIVDWREHHIQRTPSAIAIGLGALTAILPSSTVVLASITNQPADMFFGFVLGGLAYYLALGFGYEITSDRIIGRGDRDILFAAGATCGASHLLYALLPTMAVYIVIVGAIKKSSARSGIVDDAVGLPLAPGIAASVAIGLIAPEILPHF